MADVNVRVYPGSAIDSIKEATDTIIRIAIKEQAREGKANRALISFLSKALSIPKSRITIVRGNKSRDKVIRIEALRIEEIINRLNKKMKP